MGLRYRDLVMDVAVECMPGGPAPGGCICTQTANAPACQQKSHKPEGPNCPKPSVKAPNPKKAGGLEALRRQLRAELTTSG